MPASPSMLDKDRFSHVIFSVVLLSQSCDEWEIFLKVISTLSGDLLPNVAENCSSLMNFEIVQIDFRNFLISSVVDLT